MEFKTYTYKGLLIKLHQEVMKDEMDIDLVKSISEELNNRSLLKMPQMSPKEQIHWIMDDMNWDRIVKVEEFIKLETGEPFLPVTTKAMKRYALDALNSVVEIDEMEYETVTTTRGRFEATRSIYDGIMCLSLNYIVSGWFMDYDCVISENYSDDKYEGEIDD